MKKAVAIIIAVVMTAGLQAQFSKAVLQASGLTCAMCTRAIDNSLKQLPFVATVAPDIKNSAFSIVFKEGVSVNIDAIKKAVEDAGFSVAKLKITADFNHVTVKNDEHVTIYGTVFHFINITGQVLNGEEQLTIVDKDFITAKEFKKYSNATSMQCIQTGRAASCCDKAGVAAGTRIYHVTI